MARAKRADRLISIVNYGIGNLLSVANAFHAIGAECELVTEPGRLRCATKLVLPGVGAFGACMSALTSGGFRDAVLTYAHSGKPLLGICVGMQMLAEVGTEFGEHAGLGLVSGTVVQIPRTSPAIRLPHVGWSALDLRKDCALTRNLGKDTSAYFVHSFHLQAQDDRDVAATVEYGSRVTAMVSRGNIFGVQFHPEKSQLVGLAILKNFVAL
jgi:imidazole glycerol-phosphate synthase subunit HisH